MEAIDMKMIFYSHVDKTHFHKKSFALSLLLKVRVFGTREWPFLTDNYIFSVSKKGNSRISVTVRRSFCSKLQYQ